MMRQFVWKHSHIGNLPVFELKHCTYRFIIMLEIGRPRTDLPAFFRELFVAYIRLSER